MKKKAIRKAKIKKLAKKWKLLSGNHRRKHKNWITETLEVWHNDENNTYCLGKNIQDIYMTTDQVMLYVKYQIRNANANGLNTIKEIDDFFDDNRDGSFCEYDVTVIGE